MKSIDRRADELRDLVQGFLRQFQLLNTAVATAPHMDLSLQEMRLVEYLGDGGPRMMRELAEYLSLAVNSVTSVVDRLEQRELVRRLRSDADRRVVRVELTDAGRKAYDACIGEKMGVFRTMLHGLTEDEQEIFMVLFRKIARAGRYQTERLTGA